MTEHSFQTGQQVALLGTTLNKNAAPGPYNVVRQMPYGGTEFHYRISSPQEGYERAVSESEIRCWSDLAARTAQLPAERR